MILRRLFCLALVLGFTAPCLAQQRVAETDKQFTAEVLKTMLFAKTDDEKKFCDYIIQKRDDGTIPAALIYGVYQKAMTKERGRRFVYFKTGLELVCKQYGIVLYPVVSAKTLPSTPSPFSSAFKSLFNRI